MAGKGSKPEIRFKEFEGDWEQHKLSAITERVVKKNTSLESKLPLTISAQYGLVNQITYFNNRVASHNISNYYLIKRGEFAYNKSYSDGFPFGAVKRLNDYEMGVLSTLYILFAHKKTMVDSDYLVSYYDTDNWHKEIAKRAAEGARNHGLLNISADDFFNTELKCPQNTIEQSCIGTFFKNLDSLITLHQRKYDKLTTVKKSMLEKMFPKDGANVPEIRFAGFGDRWKQLKLKDIAFYSYGGGTPATSNEAYWEGSIPWIQSSDLVESQVFGVAPRKHISKAGLKNSAAKLIPQNSIAIITRVGVGKLAVIPFPYATSQDFLSLSNLKTEVDFSVYAIYRKLQEELSVVQGTSIKGITKEELLAKSIFIPTKTEEQTQIGTFFKQLDTLVTLQQQELEKLKNIKKALLEKMFV